MPNRYCRDEIIKIALDQAILPNLAIHDIPDGVVLPDAFSIQWLQDILDFWYHMCPFSATVTNTPLNCVALQDYVVLPSDFILDVRNGYTVVQTPGDNLTKQRIYRVPFQKFLTRKITYQKTSTNVNAPIFYCIHDTDATGKMLMHVTPTPTIATVGELWYYKLPPVLQANDKPKFPNDYVCIEYVKIRALEWANIFKPGTAHDFCEKIVAGMKSAGLMNEPEDDEIPFDPLAFRHNSGIYNSTYAWMGDR